MKLHGIEIDEFTQGYIECALALALLLLAAPVCANDDLYGTDYSPTNVAIVNGVVCTTARTADPDDECFIPATCRECRTDGECEALCPESLAQQEEDCTDVGGTWVNDACKE